MGGDYAHYKVGSASCTVRVPWYCGPGNEMALSDVQLCQIGDYVTVSEGVAMFDGQANLRFGYTASCNKVPADRTDDILHLQFRDCALCYYSNQLPLTPFSLSILPGTYVNKTSSFIKTKKLVSSPWQPCVQSRLAGHCEVTGHQSLTQCQVW